MVENHQGMLAILVHGILSILFRSLFRTLFSLASFLVFLKHNWAYSLILVRV